MTDNGILEMTSRTLFVFDPLAEDQLLGLVFEA